jgi:predicted RNA binding protein YcfA (HicA-like mRNA interferase family)
MKFGEIRRCLKDDGFEKIRQKGSHERWFKPPDKRVTIAGKDSETPDPGTLNNIYKQAGWSKQP